MVRVMLAAMSKAFDMVDHAQLLQHLANVELCPRHSIWVSTRPEVSSGVPQGDNYQVGFHLGHSN